MRVAQHELLASNAVLTRKMLGVAVANGVALQQSEAAAAARPSEKAADVVVAAFNGRIANHLAAERDAKAAMHARTFARTRVLETLVEVPRADDIHNARLHAAEWPAREHQSNCLHTLQMKKVVFLNIECGNYLKMI